MESDIAIAIADSKQTTIKESQKNLSMFVVDGKVAMRSDSVAKKIHLNERLGICQYHKQEDKRTQNVRRYHDYDRCMGKAEDQFLVIMADLDELYGKTVEIFNSDTFVQTEKLYEMDDSKTEQNFNLNVNDRAGFLSSIFNWLNGQYNAYLKGDPVLGTPWQGDLEQNWKDYGVLLNDTVSTDSGEMYHPGSYDDSFLTYVQNTERLPNLDNLAFLYDEITKTSVTDYNTEQLEGMCYNVRNTEKIANLSRKNLIHAHAVYLYFLNKLHFKMEGAFLSMIDGLIESYDDYKDDRVGTDFKPKSLEECRAESAYKDQKTNIFTYISENNYTASQFLGANSEAIASIVDKASQSSYINEESVQNQGFSYAHPTDTVCELRNGEPITKGWVESDSQVKDLEDTLEKVQSGEQGGCWFTDKYGLISGVAGERIQLYQKTNIDPETGRDYGYETIFKPMCSVFVTKGNALYFITETWTWDEPAERGICIDVNFEFIYELGVGFFREYGYQHRLYYLNEAGVQTGESPKRVSAKKYIERLWDMTEHKLTEEKKNL